MNAPVDPSADSTHPLSEGTLADEIAGIRASLAAPDAPTDWQTRTSLHTRLGLLLQQAGQPAAARQAFHDSLDAIPADDPVAPIVRGQVLRNFGVLERELGEPERAREHAESALALFEQSDEQEFIGMTLVDLGLLDKDQGRLPQARARLERAVRILEPLELPGNLAHAFVGLGLVEEAFNRPDRARPCYDRALAGYRAADDKTNQAVVLHNTAMLFEKEDRFAEALDYLEQSLHVNREIGSQIGQIDDLARIAGIYQHSGHGDRARPLHEMVLQLAENANLHIAQIDTLVDLALLDREQHAFAAADQRLARAQALAESIDAPHHLGEVCLVRGDTARLANDLPAALEHYQTAAGAAEQLRAVFSQEDEHLDYFSESRLEVYDRLVSLSPDAVRALEWAERARGRGLLTRMRLSGLSRAASAPAELYDRERELFTELFALLPHGNEPPSQDLDRLNQRRRLEERLGQVWDQLAQSDSEYVALRRGSPVTWPELRQLLRP
jgi:tetratricopeptide (TPR) repeat protein